MGGGTAVLDMLTIPVVAAGKTLTGVTLTDTNGWGNLQIDFSGLTADFTPPAPPAPTPPPAGTGDETGNHNGDHRHGDKPATTVKSAEKHEANRQNHDGKHDDGGDRGHNHRDGDN
jgi:hypothetical protein